MCPTTPRHCHRRFPVETTRCLITGGTDPDSIGFACARALILEEGVRHVCFVTRHSTAEALDRTMIDSLLVSSQEEEDGQSNDNNNKNEYNISFVVGDLKEPESMPTIVQEATQKLGGPIDVLIISGGNGSSEYLGVESDLVQHTKDTKDDSETTKEGDGTTIDNNMPAALDGYRMNYDVAVLSPLALVQAAFGGRLLTSTTEQPQPQQRPASVVMVGSMAPRVPWPNTMPYNCARAAQTCLIETLAFQYRTSGVRINGVLPACIHTGQLNRMATKKHQSVEVYAQTRADRHPMQRNGTPHDVAQTVLFLASSYSSSFMTGELVQVDGGLHLSNWFNQPAMMAEYRGGGT